MFVVWLSLGTKTPWLGLKKTISELKIPVLVTTNTARDVPTYHQKYMASLNTDVAVNCQEVSLNMLKQSLKLL